MIAAAGQQAAMNADIYVLVAPELTVRSIER
jgi:hypothetical protein